MLLLVSRIATQASIGDVDASQATPSISTTHPPTQPQVQQHGAGSSRKRARGSSIRSSTLHDVWAPSLKKQAENVEERFFLPVQHSLPCFTYRRLQKVAREISLVGLPRMLKIKHFQFHGGKSLVVSILHCSVWLCEISQEMSSSGAERLWSIMGDIHTKDQNRLNTPQLDRLAFVNANLRVLEKAGGLEGVRPINWLSKQVDHWQIVVEAADVSQLQPRTAKDDVYDFIREDMMRSSRQTHSTTRRLRGESAVGTSSARPQRAARAREPRHSVAELTSASGRLTPTPSECESDDSCESDGSE
ncbi:hypothetical protein L7F22_062496 [Adiantum nelumboides]|nr:hypothetical protein [Adiantum nelumboides]